MALTPGSRLGPYEILAPVSGAEGKAYKATDSRRDRPVTIRLLPEEISRNPVLSQRLESEARAVAALNHANIAAVFEVSRHEDLAFVVTEYLEGETLEQRLSRGPLDLDAALHTGIALADALDKAHRQGIAHRTLNPSCIVFTEGGVKLLDFGMTETATAIGVSATVSTASTRTILPAVTAPISAMPYLSPEQLEGKAGDPRSDVFALGAILFEMITGKRAFEGKTPALVVAAIQTIDPEPVSKTQPHALPALDFLVQRCLVKDPQKRLPSSWDVLCQLQWILQGGAQAGAEMEGSARRRKLNQLSRIALAAASLLALVLVPFAYRYYTATAAPTEARYTVSELGFSQGAGAGTPALSPDGHWLVTARMITDPGADALALDSVTKQILVPGQATYMIFFKPNNQEIGFFGEDKLKAVSIAGGQPRNITDAPQPFGGATWSPSGEIVFSSAGVLYRVRDVGGERVAIAKLDEGQQETEYLAPYFLPDGRHFLYLAMSSDPSKSAIYVASLDSSDRTRLFESQSRAFYAYPGYILFNRGDVVYAWEFDAAKLAVKGEPIRIADGVPPIGVVANTPMPMSLRESATFSVSQNGVLAFRTGSAARGRGNTAAPASDGSPLSLVWGGGTTPPAAVGTPGAYAGVSLAPDGKRFAVHRHEGSGGDIWLYDPNQSGLQRWTLDVSQENSSPVWSPDGKRIAFASRRNGKWGIYIKSADLTGGEDRVLETALSVAPMSWSQPEELVYWIDDPKTLGDVWAIPLTGERKPVPVLQTPAQELYPQVSADGKWIAYQSPDATGTYQIWINSYPKKQQGWQITNNGGMWPRWRTDGKSMQVFYDQPPTIMSISIRVVGAGIQWDAPQSLFSINNPNLIGSSHYSVLGSYHRFAVSADGQRFLIPQPAATAPSGRGGARGGMLADGVAVFVDGRGANSGGPATTDIAIVLNWPRLLKPH